MNQFSVLKSRLFKQDFLLILLILISPFIIYLHQFFPSRVEYYENNYFRLESHYYHDIQAMIYMISTKMVFILIYSVWYVTSKNWWKSIILLPLIFSIYQFILVVNDEVKYVDDFEEMVCAIIVSIPIILGLIFLSKKLNVYNESNDLKDNINKEIDDLVVDISKFNTNNFKTIKEEIINLRNQKNKHTKEDYLVKLIHLRDKLYDM